MSLWYAKLNDLNFFFFLYLPGRMLSGQVAIWFCVALFALIWSYKWFTSCWTCFLSINIFSVQCRGVIFIWVMACCARGKCGMVLFVFVNLAYPVFPAFLPPLCGYGWIRPQTIKLQLNQYVLQIGSDPGFFHEPFVWLKPCNIHFKFKCILLGIKLSGNIEWRWLSKSESHSDYKEQINCVQRYY